MVGPLIPSHHLGLLQTPLQAYGQESLTDGACLEPRKEVRGAECHTERITIQN